MKVFMVIKSVFQIFPVAVNEDFFQYTLSIGKTLSKMIRLKDLIC